MKKTKENISLTELEKQNILDFLDTLRKQYKFFNLKDKKVLIEFFQTNYINHFNKTITIEKINEFLKKQEIPFIIEKRIVQEMSTKNGTTNIIKWLPISIIDIQNNYDNITYERNKKEFFQMLENIENSDFESFNDMIDLGEQLVDIAQDKE